MVHILQQPFITGVSRVCKPIPLSASFQNGQNTTTCSRSAHVDIVCTLNGNPVWFIVSDRNPKYISWHGDEPCRNKGLSARIKQVLDAAQSTVTLKPSSIILFFSNGLADSVFKKLQEEFGAAKCDLEFSNFDCSFSEELDGEWIDIIARSYRHASILEIMVDCLESTIYSSMECCDQDSLLGAVRPDLSEENSDLNLGGSFCSLMSQMKSSILDVKNADFSVSKDLSGKARLINFDTTALIAIVSGISNGNTDKLLATPENILRTRFKSNFEFVMAQVYLFTILFLLLFNFAITALDSIIMTILLHLPLRKAAFLSSLQSSFLGAFQGIPLFDINGIERQTFNNLCSTFLSLIEGLHALICCIFSLL